MPGKKYALNKGKVGEYSMTIFQDILVENTIDAVDGFKVKQEYLQAIETLTRLGFNVYSKVLLADNFRLHANIEWKVEESVFSHTINVSKFDGIWGLDKLSIDDIPILPKQFAVFINALMKYLPGQLNVRRFKKECGCYEYSYSVIKDNVEFIDMWDLFVKCDFCMEEEFDTIR